MINIVDYKALKTTEAGWTKAFETAVSDLETKGGGVLYVPAGTYNTYPIQLKSNMNLYLEPGTELKFISNLEGYPVIESESEGRKQKVYMPCIYAKDSVNVSVTGTGTINGQGEYWWKRQKELTCARPLLVCFENCTRVKVSDIKLINSPAWTVCPSYCKDVEIRGISIHNPKVSPNTDGINPNSCSNVRILDCLVDVGDDCITLKAGTEETLRKVPCENITISNCNLLHGHGGIVIGSEMSGTVKNVTVTNCTFVNTDRGIRVKTRRGRGGVMERVQISNSIMENVLCPFTFNMYYKCGATGEEYKEKEYHAIDQSTPRIRNIQINNVQVYDAVAAAGYFYGLPEMPVEDITLSDCYIAMKKEGTPDYPAMMDDVAPMQANGVYMRYCNNIVFRNVKIVHHSKEMIDKDQVQNFTMT